MVPWIGFPLAALLKEVEPNCQGQVRRVPDALRSKADAARNRAGIELPYVEGLRLDEAMHPLALLAVGLYGETLPNQNGAPFRLVVPWKYGFKSIKSIVKITLTDKQPPTTWNITNAREYGFYSNVNPDSGSSALEPGHRTPPRRTVQAEDADVQRLWRQVASLYTGMDLRKNY